MNFDHEIVLPVLSSANVPQRQVSCVTSYCVSLPFESPWLWWPLPNISENKPPAGPRPPSAWRLIWEFCIRRSFIILPSAKLSVSLMSLRSLWPWPWTLQMVMKREMLISYVVMLEYFPCPSSLTNSTQWGVGLFPGPSGGVLCVYFRRTTSPL